MRRNGDVAGAALRGTDVRREIADMANSAIDQTFTYGLMNSIAATLGNQGVWGAKLPICDPFDGPAGRFSDEWVGITDEFLQRRKC